MKRTASPEWAQVHLEHIFDCIGPVEWMISLFFWPSGGSNQRRNFSRSEAVRCCQPFLDVAESGMSTGLQGGGQHRTAFAALIVWLLGTSRAAFRPCHRGHATSELGLRLRHSLLRGFRDCAVTALTRQAVLLRVFGRLCASEPEDAALPSGQAATLSAHEIQGSGATEIPGTTLSLCAPAGRT